MKYLFALYTFLFASHLSGQNNLSDSLGYELYLAQISLSEAQLQMGEISDAKATLTATDPVRRGWEYDYLHATLDRSQRTLTDHGASVSFVTFSPDGKLMASGGMDSTIILWSYPDFKIFKKLKGHTGGVSTLDFSPDSRWLASGSRDFTVKIWDVSSGQELQTLTEGLSRGIYSVKFSPDGKRLGLTSWRFEPGKGVIGFAKVFDLGSKALLQNFDLDTHPVAGFDFSPDGKKALIVSWGEIAWYYDLESGQPDWTFDMTTIIEEYSAVTSGDISQDGRWAVITGRDYRTRLLDAATGKLIYQIEKHEGHNKWIDAVRFSHDGKYIATGAQDALLQVREAATGKLLHTFRGHTNFINAIAWHPSEPVFASASADGTMKIWNLTEPGAIAFDVCDNGPWYAPLSPTTNYMASACSDTLIGIWNLKTGQRDKVLVGKSANCAVFSPGGTMLATGSNDKIVRVWDIPNEKEYFMLEGHEASIFGIAWSGDFIASAGGNTVMIWNFTSRKVEKALAFEGKSAYAVAFTPDGKRLVAGMDNGEVFIFNTKNWEQEQHFKSGSDLKFLSLDASGKKLLTCGKYVYVWDLETGKFKEMQGHKAAVWGAVFHPDGRYAVSCSYDHTVKFWDTLTGRCTLTIHGFEDELFKTGVLDGGRGILVTETQGVVHAIRF